MTFKLMKKHVICPSISPYILTVCQPRSNPPDPSPHVVAKRGVPLGFLPLLLIKLVYTCHEMLNRLLGNAEFSWPKMIPQEVESLLNPIDISLVWMFHQAQRGKQERTHPWRKPLGMACEPVMPAWCMISHFLAPSHLYVLRCKPPC